MGLYSHVFGTGCGVLYCQKHIFVRKENVMNISHSAPSSINRLSWLMAAAIMISLSIFLVSNPNNLSIISANPPPTSSPAFSVNLQDHAPQVMPVPAPSQSQLSPAQAPKMSATPSPVETRPYPRVQPVPTPPAGK